MASFVSSKVKCDCLLPRTQHNTALLSLFVVLKKKKSRQSTILRSQSHLRCCFALLRLLSGVSCRESRERHGKDDRCGAIIKALVNAEPSHATAFASQRVPPLMRRKERPRCRQPSAPATLQTVIHQVPTYDLSSEVAWHNLRLTGWSLLCY